VVRETVATAVGKFEEVEDCVCANAMDASVRMKAKMARDNFFTRVLTLGEIRTD